MFTTLDSKFIIFTQGRDIFDLHFRTITMIAIGEIDGWTGGREQK